MHVIQLGSRTKHTAGSLDPGLDELYELPVGRAYSTPVLQRDKFLVLAAKPHCLNSTLLSSSISVSGRSVGLKIAGPAIRLLNPAGPDELDRELDSSVTRALALV